MVDENENPLGVAEGHERSLLGRLKRWYAVNHTAQEWVQAIWVPGFTKRKRWIVLRRALWTATSAFILVGASFLYLAVQKGKDFPGVLLLLWALATLLLVLVGLLVPYGVRWMIDKVEHYPSLFRKQVLVFGTAAVVPTLFLGPALYFLYWIGKGDVVLGSQVTLLCLYLGCGFFLLNALAVLWMAYELSCGW